MFLTATKQIYWSSTSKMNHQKSRTAWVILNFCWCWGISTGKRNYVYENHNTQQVFLVWPYPGALRQDFRCLYPDQQSLWTSLWNSFHKHSRTAYRIWLSSSLSDSTQVTAFFSPRTTHIATTRGHFLSTPEKNKIKALWFHNHPTWSCRALPKP